MTSTQSVLADLQATEGSQDIVDGTVPGASQKEDENEAPENRAPDVESTLSKTAEASSVEQRPLPTSASVKGWEHFKKHLAKLDAAVQNAVAVSDGLPLKPSTDTRSIYLSLGDGLSFKIPWQACRTWQRMLTFLRSWFAEDGIAMKALEDGNFMINHIHFRAPIHPALWDQVVEPGAALEFSQQVPEEVTALLAPPAVVTDETPKTNYDNRVQYKVSFYQRQQLDGRSHFVSESVFAQPVELAVNHDDTKVPVLEERKSVESPPTDLGRSELAPRRTNVRRPRLRQDDVVSEPVLKINSPYLLNLLKAVVCCSAEPPAGDNEGLDAGLFKFPYMDLYLHLDDLLRYKAGDSELRRRHSEEFNQLADEHIGVLQEYLESQSAVQYKEAKARWTTETPLTTFGTLWLLMKPATDVYVREADGSLSRYVLDRLRGGAFRNEAGKKATMKYTAQVWNTILDDRAIRQYSRQVVIPVFDDERKITELPIFPVHFRDAYDGGALRQSLIDRGKKYFEYSKRPCFLQYTGQGLKAGSKLYKRTRAVIEHNSRPWTESVWGSDLEHFMPTSKVIEAAPHKTSSYSSSLPPPPAPPLPTKVVIGESIRVARCECPECEAHSASQKIYHQLKFSEYREIDPNKEPQLGDHHYSILPSHMFAFVLKDRTYDLFDVARLQDPNMAETAIDRLVMDLGNKDLIKAIAKIYTDNTERFSADFIYGKGEGQIILLHGPPGTGKTLTAESVAEFTKRPLLSITAADLGHEPDALEKSLLQYFRRANDWDAIVLLDEADVYLEERTPHDLKRNSIVSVFLRALDYFQGILFLTTNRVGQFDEAFMSRIHLSLGYATLNDDARGQIWENLFQKLQEDFEHNDGPEIRYDYYAKEYVTKNAEVTALQWNGREIRNAFQTAVALAVYDAKHKNKDPVPKVTESHLKQVVSMSSAFRKYIKAAHNDEDHSARAFRLRNRDDGAQLGPQK